MARPIEALRICASEMRRRRVACARGVATEACRRARNGPLLLERVRPWFEALSRPTVCVTHGGVIRTLFRMVGKFSENDAAALEIVQDRILKLENSSIEWL